MFSLKKGASVYVHTDDKGDKIYTGMEHLDHNLLQKWQKEGFRDRFIALGTFFSVGLTNYCIDQRENFVKVCKRHLRGCLISTDQSH
jgi:hypothetical protein